VYSEDPTPADFALNQFRYATLREALSAHDHNFLERRFSGVCRRSDRFQPILRVARETTGAFRQRFGEKRRFDHT